MSAPLAIIPHTTPPSGLSGSIHSAHMFALHVLPIHTSPSRSPHPPQLLWLWSVSLRRDCPQSSTACFTSWKQTVWKERNGSFRLFKGEEVNSISCLCGRCGDQHIRSRCRTRLGTLLQPRWHIFFTLFRKTLALFHTKGKLNFLHFPASLVQENGNVIWWLPQPR